ncbi:mechanosensitive ion channel family protein [Teredinibacter haidensis]|uniref:mechanosensitive ion channel family protein n=1 Tax=Teredinibacter haidensis TaxID=2731755 RepID=UPI000948BC4A|nr:mechanosensitive ion channel family protein [Teredinibacter haidensis]
MTAIILIVLITFYWLGRKALDQLVQKIATEKRVPPHRSQYIGTTLRIGWLLLAINATAIAIGVNFSDMGFVITSIFAMLGVALFATWSILSNITASVFVFFFFPYRPGDWVKIIDGDNSISGIISEITLFHVILTGEEDGVIHTYPNSMVFQKAVSIRKNLKPNDTQTAQPSAQPAEQEPISNEIHS